MSTYIIQYVIENYKMSDVFRPDPKWGKREFRCTKEDLPPHTDEELIKVSRDTCPKGYRLFKVSECGNNHRDIWVATGINLFPKFTDWADIDD